MTARNTLTDYTTRARHLLLSRVKGGTYYPVTVKKHLRAQAIAQENRKSGPHYTWPTK